MERKRTGKRRKTQDRSPRLTVLSVENQTLVECQLESTKGKTVTFKFDMSDMVPEEIASNLVVTNLLAEQHAEHFIEQVQDIVYQLRENPDRLPVVQSSETSASCSPTLQRRQTLRDQADYELVKRDSIDSQDGSYVPPFKYEKDSELPSSTQGSPVRSIKQPTQSDSVNDLNENAAGAEVPTSVSADVQLGDKATGLQNVQATSDVKNSQDLSSGNNSNTATQHQVTARPHVPDLNSLQQKLAELTSSAGYITPSACPLPADTTAACGTPCTSVSAVPNLLLEPVVSTSASIVNEPVVHEQPCPAQPEATTPPSPVRQFKSSTSSVFQVPVSQPQPAVTSQSFTQPSVPPTAAKLSTAVAPTVPQDVQQGRKLTVATNLEDLKLELQKLHSTSSTSLNLKNNIEQGLQAIFSQATPAPTITTPAHSQPQVFSHIHPPSTPQSPAGTPVSRPSLFPVGIDGLQASTPSPLAGLTFCSVPVSQLPTPSGYVASEIPNHLVPQGTDVDPSSEIMLQDSAMPAQLQRELQASSEMFVNGISQFPNVQNVSHVILTGSDGSSQQSSSVLEASASRVEARVPLTQVPVPPSDLQTSVTSSYLYSNEMDIDLRKCVVPNGEVFYEKQKVSVGGLAVDSSFSLVKDQDAEIPLLPTPLCSSLLSVPELTPSVSKVSAENITSKISRFEVTPVREDSLHSAIFNDFESRMPFSSSSEMTDGEIPPAARMISEPVVHHANVEDSGKKEVPFTVNLTTKGRFQVTRILDEVGAECETKGLAVAVQCDDNANVIPSSGLYQDKAIQTCLLNSFYYEDIRNLKELENDEHLKEILLRQQQERMELESRHRLELERFRLERYASFTQSQSYQDLNSSNFLMEHQPLGRKDIFHHRSLGPVARCPADGKFIPHSCSSPLLQCDGLSRDEEMISSLTAAADQQQHVIATSCGSVSAFSGVGQQNCNLDHSENEHKSYSASEGSSLSEQQPTSNSKAKSRTFNDDLFRLVHSLSSKSKAGSSGSTLNNNSAGEKITLNQMKQRQLQSIIAESSSGGGVSFTSAAGLSSPADSPLSSPLPSHSALSATHLSSAYHHPLGPMPAPLYDSSPVSVPHGCSESCASHSTRVTSNFVSPPIKPNSLSLTQMHRLHSSANPLSTGPLPPSPSHPTTFVGGSHSPNK